MLLRKFTIAVAAAASAVTMSTSAQTAPPAPAAAPQAAAAAAVPEGGEPKWVRPETPEQRRLRLGTTEDPGTNPDPNKHYLRHGRSYHIGRWTRRETIFDPNDPTLVRHMYVNFWFELYQQNEQFTWVWMGDPEETPTEEMSAAPPPDPGRWQSEHIAYFKKIRPQFAELAPPASSKTVTFQQSSKGLPQSGSWRNSLAVADMNGDGFPDLVTPPERKGNSEPQIFLGDGKGNWRVWEEAKFPHGIDYGGVAAADFNKDGHVDLVFAVHLNGVYVFLGDGKGNFTESLEGLPRDYPTRRVTTADLDADGYPDILVSSEGPTILANNEGYAKVRAYLNRKKGTVWEGVNATDMKTLIGGDWLSVGNFNGDRVPDFVVSSVYFSSWDVVHLSEGPKRWKAVASDGDLLPSLSYYLGSATGKYTKGAQLDDAIIAYTRHWPSDLDNRIVPTPDVPILTNIDRLVFTKNGMKRVPIMRWASGVGVRGLASGDFDGDGNLDVILANEDPQQRGAVILLGDGKGNFSRAGLEGLTLDENNLYDVKVADVDLDGKPDVILMYEIMQIRRDDMQRMAISDRPGSIKVFLNRGARKNATPALKVAK